MTKPPRYRGDTGHKMRVPTEQISKKDLSVYSLGALEAPTKTQNIGADNGVLKMRLKAKVMIIAKNLVHFGSRIWFRCTVLRGCVYCD